MGWAGICLTSCWSLLCPIKPFAAWLRGWFGEGGLIPPGNAAARTCSVAITQPQTDVSKRGKNEVSPKLSISQHGTHPFVAVQPVLPSLALLFLLVKVQRLVHKPVGPGRREGALPQGGTRGEK